jgi:hypothetical protein
MATIWELASAALTPLGLPMGAGVYVPATPGDDLPDQYLTYFMVDMSPEQHADDEETLRGYLVQVSVYSRYGLAGLPDVIGAMTGADFMFVAGRQLDYDIETRHFGIAFDFEYLETR